MNWRISNSFLDFVPVYSLWTVNSYQTKPSYWIRLNDGIIWKKSKMIYELIAWILCNLRKFSHLFLLNANRVEINYLLLVTTHTVANSLGGHKRSWQSPKVRSWYNHVNYNQYLPFLLRCAHRLQLIIHKKVLV